LGRLSDIEAVVSGQLNDYSFLRLFVRSRPKFLDKQLDRGEVRFAMKRGFSFTSVMPDNKYPLLETAAKGTNRVTISSRPGWFSVDSLIRIGPSEEVGELQLVQDLIDTNTIETRGDFVLTYLGGIAGDVVNYVSLYGTPMTFYAVNSAPLDRQVLMMESWYKMVPGDVLLLSLTPTTPETLSPVVTQRVDLTGTRAGTGVEPAVIYRYEIEVGTASGLIPFTPTVGMAAYLKALPMYLRGEDFAAGDMKIPSDVGPFLIDWFSGGFLYTNPVDTRYGVKTWDAFGSQQNVALTGNQEWQPIRKNHLILERPIPSDTFLFWQRIKGYFQYSKTGFFQAELDSNGDFIMSSDILVPRWTSDRQHGWVVPLVPQAPIQMSVTFEPQERQYFTVPGSTLTYIRPKLFVDPEGRDIQRIVIAIKGSPNSRVEMRTWEYDGQAVQALSYFMLGVDEAYGLNRWASGGFCVKPLFFNLNILKGRYSDGVTRYNAGYIYV